MAPVAYFAERGTVHDVEQGLTLQPKFDAAGLIPAVVTDAATGEVLMLAWMNAEALALTMETRVGHFWSRSRQRLWKKGAESGNVLEVSEMRTDCDQDAVWLKVRIQGDGIAFVHAGGTIVKRDLAPGEKLRVDTGCLVAFQPSVAYDIQLAGGIKTSLFGGEGLFLASLTGPGSVWLQSLPFSRLAGRIVGTYATKKGEGSILGGLGNLFEQ